MFSYGVLPISPAGHVGEVRRHRPKRQIYSIRNARGRAYPKIAARSFLGFRSYVVIQVGLQRVAAQ